MKINQCTVSRVTGVKDSATMRLTDVFLITSGQQCSSTAQKNELYSCLDTQTTLISRINMLFFYATC